MTTSSDSDFGAVKPDYQVLAAAFKVDGAIVKFAEEINPEYVGLIHGFRGIHELYKAQLDYLEHTKLGVVDPINFENWLYESKPTALNLIGGASGYKDLYERLSEIEVPETDALIKLIEYRGDKRRRIDHVQKMLAAVTDSDDPDTREKIPQLSDELVDLYRKIDYDPLDRVRTVDHIIADIDKLTEIPPFLPTPYPALNKALAYNEDTGGFFRGAVHAIAALSGQGKSTFVKCLCNHWLDIGFNVLFINFEEAQGHWERILLTQLTGVNVYAQELDRFARIEFENKLRAWGDRLKVRHDPDTLFYEDLEIWIRDIIGYSKWRPDVIVIDTIQSMFFKSGGTARWGEFEQIMVRLEKLAKDMDAAVIVTAQQNRNSLQEKRQVINQTDMAGGSTITQKSSVAMFITAVRDSGENFDQPRNVVEVQMPKNRITGNSFSEMPPRLLYNDKTKSFESYDDKMVDNEQARASFKSIEVEDSDKELGYA